MSAGIEAAIALHWWKVCLGILGGLLGFKFQKDYNEKEERLKKLETACVRLSEQNISDKGRITNLETITKQLIEDREKINDIHTSVAVIQTEIVHLKEGKNNA